MYKTKPPHIYIIIALLILGIAIFMYGLKQRGSINEDAPEKREVILLDILTTVLAQPIDAPEFTLTDHDQQAFKRENLKGKWTFLFFGYTNCPDICPATMDKLNGVYEALKRKGALRNTAFAFISLDPKRDKAPQLAEYVRYFNDTFIGITGDEKEIQALAAHFGVMYDKYEETSEEDYLIQHGTAILLIHPSGRYFARFSVPHDTETIASDFLKIRKKYE